MPQDNEESPIRDFMQKAAFGESNEGKRMKYDPKLKRFVVVDADDPDADDLPAITPEDLQSFAPTPRAGVRS